MNSTLTSPTRTSIDLGERVSLLGICVDPVDPPLVEQKLDEFARSGTHRQIVTVNLDFLAVGRRNRDFLDTVNCADLVVPDGAPVLWALRKRGHRLSSRVTGQDLVEMAVRHSQRNQSSLYFVGGQDGVAEQAAMKLTQRLGTFNLAGCYAPDVGVDAGEDARVARHVRAASPDFVFVGFGCPKQDLWISSQRDILERCVCVGVGGTFNYLAGVVRRAPRWAQRRGLEWFFRLATEPRRLARRYVIDDAPVLVRLGWQMWSERGISPLPEVSA